MPSQSPDSRVLVVTRDLFFRAKLEAVVRAAGSTVVKDEPAEFAVIELVDQKTIDRVRELSAHAVRVIAFTSHTQAQLLRAARDAGANAVPNSEIEGALSRWLAQPR